jgi:hypothetical protein
MFTPASPRQDRVCQPPWLQQLLLTAARLHELDSRIHCYYLLAGCFLAMTLFTNTELQHFERLAHATLLFCYWGWNCQECSGRVGVCEVFDFCF